VDAEGAARNLAELKSLGLKTFLMPLSPGKDEEKKPIDFCSMAMDDVWAAIEESQVPVAHHIGESPPASPSEFNGLEIGMLQAVAPFRDVFGKYILGGILDRHPGLQVGWFEGGINWVPSAIQDAQAHSRVVPAHVRLQGRARPASWYWDNHMMASFVVDPLGLDWVDRIGVDKVMWSTDFHTTRAPYG